MEPVPHGDPRIIVSHKITHCCPVNFLSHRERVRVRGSNRIIV
jgi:hypothetical protein